MLDDAITQADDAAKLRGEVERLTAANTYAEAEIARLTAIIAAFQRHRFNERSEKLDAYQLELAIEKFDQALSRVQTATDAAVATTQPREPRGDGGLDLCFVSIYPLGIFYQETAVDRQSVTGSKARVWARQIKRRLRDLLHRAQPFKHALAFKISPPRGIFD